MWVCVAVDRGQVWAFSGAARRTPKVRPWKAPSNERIVVALHPGSSLTIDDASSSDVCATGCSPVYLRGGGGAAELTILQRRRHGARARTRGVLSVAGDAPAPPVLVRNHRGLVGVLIGGRAAQHRHQVGHAGRRRSVDDALQLLRPVVRRHHAERGPLREQLRRLGCRHRREQVGVVVPQWQRRDLAKAVQERVAVRVDKVVAGRSVVVGEDRDCRGLLHCMHL